MKKTSWFKLAPALMLGLGLIAFILVVPRGGLARQTSGEPGGEYHPVALTGPVSPSLALAALGAADGPPVGSVLDLTGSSVETGDCYQADKTQMFCFTVYNGSTDGEWLNGVTLTFPDDPSPSLGPWTVSACSYQDATDSMGYTVNFSCTPSGKQVVYADSDSDSYGEISNGAGWSACVNVAVPAGYTGNRYIPWVLEGDASNTENGSIEIEQCTPLRLTPAQLSIEGCNGMTQTLEFKLENYGAGDVNLDFTYDAPEADFTGYHPANIQSGETITFLTTLKPDLCLEPGEQINASLTVEAPGVPADTSAITQTITEDAGWRRRGDSPVPTMDSVVVWASHRDGGLWSIGGYGSNGAVQRYDPGSDTWQTGFESEAVITPLIEYPVDGCYGLDGPDPDTAHEIVVLFPDTLMTETLHVYDITTDNWYTRPIPGFFPSDYIGHWGFDVVSLLNNPVVHDIADTNMCYLSGGNHQKPGGGTTRNLWRYDPEINSGEFITHFADSGVVFGFHASWYVPWIGTSGSICVAGGADHNHYIHDKTQCIDLAAGAPASEDLGVLPEPWWGMADGWQITDDGYELWIANGVAQDGTLLPISAYIREGMSNFAYGPEIPDGLYRLEGDAWENQFYTLNGSRGGFWYSKISLHLAACPTCPSIYLPLVLRNH
ncbi:MAG: hypothetical protein ACE5OS_08995 [Anaerolineae bacterium]